VRRILVALLAIGCAGERPPQHDAGGLVRQGLRKPGNLFAHPTLSIDDYDDVWLGEIGIQYADGQEPLAEADEKQVPQVIHDLALRELPAADALAAHQGGACTLKMGVHLAALAFPRPGLTGPRNHGAALVVVELRDSQTNEPLVRYGQRRDLPTGIRRAEQSRSNVERLEETLEPALGDAGAALRALPVKATGALAARGCRGAVGELRKNRS
jgi:hypothetical protein